MLIFYLRSNPAPLYLSLAWNLGSFLGIVLFLQTLTGLMLVLYYTPTVGEAFSSVDYIIREVNNGWLVRSFHVNGASLFMFLSYLHILKALYMGGYRLATVWFSGILILFISILTAFFGYVLVCSQISYWASVVITSLVTVLPFGDDMLLWIWAGYSPGTHFLHFSFLLHFLLPFVLSLLVVLHLSELHNVGSTSVLGYSGGLHNGWFWPYYFVQDCLNFIPWIIFFIFVLLCPTFLSDPEMYSEANILSSPAHIVPEWYFCAQYEILRAIPNNTLGVLALLSSIFFPMILALVPVGAPLLSGFSSLLINFLVITFVLLTWFGHAPAVTPYLEYGLFFTFLYFFIFILLWLLAYIADFFFL